MTNTIALLLIAAGLCACVSNQTEPAAGGGSKAKDSGSVSASSGKNCRWEGGTGSRLGKKKICD